MDGKEYVFDIIRKKHVVLTQEEWVRQQLIHYLVHNKSYPAILMSVEKQIQVGSTKKRYDLVVYKQDQPWLLLECKAEHTLLNEVVLQQILAYKSVLPVAYLSISNGKQIFSYSVKDQHWLEGFPEYV